MKQSQKGSRSRLFPFIGAAVAGWSGPLASQVRAQETTYVRANLDDVADTENTGNSDLDPRAFSMLSRITPAGMGGKAPLAVGLSAGYGLTESVLGNSDKHSRMVGGLAAEYAATSWLALGLRLDGRYDSHTLDNGDQDTGWTGEPRIGARVHTALSSETTIGGRVGIWLPGDDAPSVKLGASTIDIAGLFSWVPSDGPVALSANLGYRVDGSAESAPNARKLSAADRLALGVSEFNAALVGLGATVGREKYQGFVEWSWDLLLGAKAPPALSSPMRVGLGGRMKLNDSVALEAMAEVSPSSRIERATVPMDVILAPVQPRFAAMAGLVATWGAPKAVRPIAERPKRVAAAPAAVVLSSLEAAISAGGGLPPGVVVTVKTSAGEKQSTPDAAGRLVFADLPVGPAQISASAPGFDTAQAEVQLVAGAPVQINLEMKPSLPPGQVRGTVRSFGGKGVSAMIRISGAAGQTANAPAEIKTEAGAFQIDVPPGQYEVTITAPDYETQTRTVKVEQNGVTVLNVDLRRAAGK